MKAWIPIVTFALGLLLRPLVDALTRRQKRKEDWQNRLERLSADLSSFLWRGFTRDRPPAVVDAAYAEWEGGLQRELTLASRFAPRNAQREACDAVWMEFEKLIRRTYVVLRTREDSPRRGVVVERYEQAYGETSYALDGLVEALGGPARVARSSYTLSLRDERDDGTTEIDVED